MCNRTYISPCFVKEAFIHTAVNVTVNRPTFSTQYKEAGGKAEYVSIHTPPRYGTYKPTSYTQYKEAGGEAEYVFYPFST